MQAKKVKTQFTCIVCDKTFTKKERGLKERVCCSTSCAAKLRGIMRKEDMQDKIDEVPERKRWILFWDYESPRMLARHLKTKVPGLPKDSFELETYKICEEKFYTESVINYRALQDRLAKT